MAIPSYRDSIKNPEIEEVVDLLVHRPLGYAVARAAYPTAVSADALTVVSMLLGVLSGAALYVSVFTAHRWHVAAGLLLIASAVFDCSDGQLARMRRRATRFGRMLDGAVDAVVQVSAIPAAVVFMVHLRGGLGAPGSVAWAVAGVLAILAGIRHTTLYDQFKNVYVRNTDPAPRDCDDLDQIAAEWRAVQARGPVGFATWFRYKMYLLHLGLVAQTMRVVDPHIPARFADMPPYDPARAERFRELQRGLMRGWSFYGVGTHIFAIALCIMAGRLEWYIALRLGVMNAALLVLVPRQRRASRLFFTVEGAAPDDATPT